MNHYKNVFHLESDLNHLLHSTTKETFTSLSIGINADSLSIWFLDAMHEYLAESLVVLDLHVDDQEETHQLFKNGKVQAYIGTQKNTHYGVITEYLGLMNYYLVCTEEFYKKWFKKGFTYESSRRAPAVLYNNKDTLHQKQLKKAFQKEPADAPTFFIPSTEKFSDLILNHHAYGMLPWLQSQLLLQQGKLIKLLPESPIPVDLYLHSWSLKSKELDQFCTTLIKKAKTILMKH